MSDVSISIEARDRVSQTLDEITRSVASLNSALEDMESTGAPDGLKGKFGDVGKTLDTIGKGFQTVGGKLTKYVTKPAIGAATGLAGMTLAKGFARMNEIDTARAKINAMGKDFGTIKEAANNAVSGTAFALNEAMTAGAQAAAAGVENDDMQTYLGAVADTAAVAGVSFGEMGQVFGKVMANGKMQAEEWNMLTDRGVDVFGIMRKATGKTNEELIEMRENGELTSDVFLDAFANAYEMKDGMTAAQQIGSSTISGAVSNIGAAMARIGANIFGDSGEEGTFAYRLLPLLASVKDALGVVEGKAKDLGSAFSDMVGPTMDKMTNFFTGIKDGSVKIDEAKVKMGAIAGVATTALGPALTIAGKAMSLIGKNGGLGKTVATFGKMGKNVLKVGGPIGLIVAGIGGMMANSESFRNSMGNLFGTLLQSFGKIATAVAPLMQSIMGILGPLLGMLGDLLAPLVDVFSSVVEVILGIVAAIAEAFGPVMESIAEAAGKAGEKIAAMGGAWAAIKAGVKKLWTTVSEKAAGILTAIKAAWDVIVSKTKSLLVKVSEGAAAVLNAIKSAWDAITSGTKTLTVQTKKYTTSVGGKNASGAGVGRLATGTSSAAGGWTLVGERGPELVNLPMGASVHTARETSDMLGGNNVVINMTNNLAQQGKSVDEIIDEFTRKFEAAVSATAEGVTA